MSRARTASADSGPPSREAAAGGGPRPVCVFAPSPICTVTIEGTGGGEPEIHFHAGGQGFWIARMVNRLGARAVLCAPLGGETGAVLRTLVEREGVALEAVPGQGWNGGYLARPPRGGRGGPGPGGGPPGAPPPGPRPPPPPPPAPPPR